MIPQTINRLPSMACISAMQKFIRRGLEVEAMEMAVEMGHTSKAFATWVTNRLQIIAHEDIGLAAPDVVVFVIQSCQLAKDHYDPEKIGVWRMIVGNAIRALCRSKKSREADHFQAAIGLRSLLEGYVPDIPDWTHDQHTLRGRQLGRGLEYFRKESTKLKPKPSEPDPYESEAYRLWTLKQEKKSDSKKLF